MGDLVLPQLWFARRNVETGLISKSPFNNQNCPGWDKAPFESMHKLAFERLKELNTKMPDKWEYSIIGWELSERNEMEAA